MSAHKTKKLLHNAVFIGIESFLVEEELGRLKGRFEGDATMNWSVFNAEENPDVGDIIGLCNTLPFLSERRVVIIRNGHKLSARQMDQISSYLENPCGSTTIILVLEMEKADRDLARLIRKFEGKADVVRFEPVKNRSERIRWIMERALFHGKTMEKDAAVLLADLAGNSLWYLDSELMKLCLYAGHRPTITIDDVHEAVTKTVEPAIFTFLDALFDRKKDALSRLCDIEQAGIGELEIISRIENFIISHYVVISGGDWKKMKIHDYVAEKAGRRRSLWNGAQLTSLLKEIRGIEQRLKTGSVINGYASLAEVIGDVTLFHRSDARSPGRT